MVARFELLIGVALSLIAAVLPAFLPYAVLAQMVLIIIAGRSASRSDVVRSLDAPLLLLGVIVVTSLLAAPFPEITTPQALRLLNGMALFRAALQTPGEMRHNFAERILMAFGVIAGASAIIVLAAQTQPRAPEALTSIDASILSGFFLTINIAVMANWRTTLLSRPLKIVHLIAAALGIAVLLTQGIVILPAAIAVGAITLLIASNPQRARILIPTALIAFLVIRLVLGIAPLAWITALFGSQRSEDLLMLRAIWNRAWRVITDFPITGIGMGAFGPVVDALYPLYSAVQARDARSNLLQILIDLGIPGAAAVFIISLRTCLIVGRALLHRHPTMSPSAQDKTTQVLLNSAITAQLLLVVTSLSGAPLWSSAWAAPLVWLLWGAAASVASTRPLEANQQAPTTSMTEPSLQDSHSGPMRGA